MYTAIYYPYTTLRRGADILKTALLLWDHLQFIVPDKRVSITQGIKNRDVQEAIELIGEQLVPDQESQEAAHVAIEDLATSQLPKDFLLNKRESEGGFLVYPGKFLQKTWNVLKESDLAIPLSSGSFEDWVLTNNTGLTIMAILANACAGEQKRCATDQTDAYQLLETSVAAMHEGKYGIAPGSADRLVTIALQIVDADRLTLKELIAFRSRELKSKGHELTRLRHGFLDLVDSHVKAINGAKKESDIKEMEERYKQKLTRDMKMLQGELKRTATDTLFTKEIGVGLLALAGAAISPWTWPSGVLATGALVGTARAYKQKRRDVMSKHAMSWLHSLTHQSRFQLY